MRRTLKARTALILGASSIAMLLLVGAACAKAAEPTATPRPAAAVAPTATPRPAAATATPAPAQVGLTQWVIGTSEDPTLNTTGLTPGGAMGANRAQRQVYESLFIFDGNDFRPRPRAAESFEYQSDTVLIFRLRKGIKGQKAGTELTSADVKYTWDTAKGNPKIRTGVTTLAYVTSIEAPDPYTVKVNFSRLDTPFLERGGSSTIIPKERGALDSPQADAFDKAPWGHGAYKPIEWVMDKPVILEANKDHYFGEATPQRLKLIWMRDASTRVASLLAGEAHQIENMPIAQASVVKARPDLAVAVSKGVRSVYWQFNTNPSHPYFSNVKVRQALNYAMNKEVVVNDVLEGFGVVTNANLSRGWNGHEESKDLKPYPYDPAKAVALLKEAGFDRGFAFDFMISSGVFQKDQEIAEAYASMWEAIGLKPRIRATERGTIFDVFREGTKWDISGTFQWGTGLEPDGFLDWLIGDYGVQIRTNPELDKFRALKAKARTTADVKERGKIYGELNRMMHEYAVSPLSHVQDEVFGVSKATGWVPMAFYASLADVPNFNYAKWVGYGPNYEKWNDSLAPSYWRR